MASSESAVETLAVDPARGLKPEGASARLLQFGPNALPEPRRGALLSVFLGQFRSPLIYLLFLAAGIALALGKRSDAGVIFAVVLLNAIIGAFQEGRAQRSLDALRRLTSQQARVLRGGLEMTIDAREVVPGDILIVEAGDAVTADARLLHAAALQVAEAALTGESVPVTKDSAPVAAETPLAERLNMVYAGTHVTAGRARGVVVATGMATEVGRIATLAEAATEPKTPLELRIAQFGRYVIVGAAAMFVIVLSVGQLRGLPFEQTVLVGISQLVGMIPEGLPVAMTIALAVGVQRMARRGAIVRRLAAVETLGSTSVICTDKTGTLTRNEMTVTAIVMPDGRELTVTGVGYAPDGAFLDGQRAGLPLDDAGIRTLLEAVALCNDAQLLVPDEAEPRWRPLGDPTEVALLTVAVKAGFVLSDLRHRLPRRAELPFDPAARMMATQHESPTGPLVFLKGAPEVMLDMCGYVHRDGQVEPLDNAARAVLTAAAERMAARALRVLAVAAIEDRQLDPAAGFEALRGHATLLGFLGQLDPPRAEVAGAVARCRAAGIRTVMVTGDHRVTGLAVARALDIARDGDTAVEGSELNALSDAELEERITSVSVFARVAPAQKLRIVEAYQRRGEVVAMTGDGVNDAPALVRADVGVAMGITGTEVAKEAAKIVITDDNFATIVAAVEEGRIVYRNIKKVILYLVTTSVAEVGVLLTALLLGYPPPLAAVQILWINLVTEGTVTVNLIMDPPEGDEMRLRPTPAGEPLLTRALLSRMAFMTPAIIVSTLGWYLVRHAADVPLAQVQTETFTVLAVCQWFNVLNCRSERRSALSGDLLKNRWLLAALVASNLLHAAVVFLPPLNDVFHTVPLGLREVLAIGAVASLVLWVEELRKFALRRRTHLTAIAAA